MGRSWGEKMTPIQHLSFFLALTPAPQEETQTQRITRTQEISCPTGAAPRQSWRLCVSSPVCRDIEGGGLCAVLPIEQGASLEEKSRTQEVGERNVVGWSTYFPLVIHGILNERDAGKHQF